MRRGEQTANVRGSLSRYQALLVPPCCWLNNWNAIALTGSAARTGLSFVFLSVRFHSFVFIETFLSHMSTPNKLVFLKVNVLRSSVCFVSVSAVWFSCTCWLFSWWWGGGCLYSHTGTLS